MGVTRYRKLLVPLMFVVTAPIVIACSDADGDADNDSPPPNMNIEYGSPGAEFRVEPPTIEFEMTEVGETATESARVENDGDQVVSIDDISVDDDNFDVAPPFSEWPDELEPGAGFDIEITYAPDAPDEHVGKLSIEFTAEYEQTRNATLEGNRSCLTADTEKLDFADVDVGEEETNTLVATNCGVPTFELRPFIGGLRTPASPDTRDAPEYEPFFIVDEDDYPVELVSDEATEVEVKYSPVDDPKWDFLLRLTPLTDFDGSTRSTRIEIPLDHGVDLSGEPIDCSDYDTNQLEEC